MSGADFMRGGGQMGAVIRAHDWARTPLGPPASWPQSLRTVIRLLLNSGHPLYLWWGPELTCFYNDAYSRSIGPERHPISLGQPAREVWGEIWPIIGPQIEQVMSGGGATWHENQLVPITRHGRREDVYWTYSYSPIDEPSAPGGIGGVLVLCTETTEQVVAARDLAVDRDRLAQLNQRLQESAEALQASEARYRDLAEELGETNRRKDEFLATLAHELRNPLAPILNAVALMKQVAHDTQAARSARERIERQIGQMVHLIDDLLDLSRVSRGIVVLQRAYLPLAHALRDAIETSRPAIEQAGHVLEVSLPEEELALDADRTRIVQVFANLLNNAAKFTPPGGRIEIRLTRGHAGGASVSVRDNGQGIPAEMLDRIFDLFTQVDRSHARVGGGLGIGLTLVRRLVEMHGGSIEARSAGVGQGSEFIVHLPLTASAAPEVVLQPAPLDKQPTTVRRILVADDNTDAAETLSDLLELLGHQTFRAQDGEQALALAREVRPDVMVLDIAMPKLSGLEVARSIRSEPWGTAILLIASSGWGQAENQLSSRQAGFDHHLVKPVNIAELEKLLAGE